MESLSDPILLSRLQFAATTLFHIVWPVLTIGLSAFLVLMEAVWLKTGDIDHYRHARFWGKLFLLTFAVGVVTGLPLEFQFGTNWAPFSVATGDYFGNILAAILILANSPCFWLRGSGIKALQHERHQVPPALEAQVTGQGPNVTE